MTKAKFLRFNCYDPLTNSTKVRIINSEYIIEIREVNEHKTKPLTQLELAANNETHFNVFYVQRPLEDVRMMLNQGQQPI